jgi:hypothetical protein
MIKQLLWLIKIRNCKNDFLGLGVVSASPSGDHVHSVLTVSAHNSRDSSSDRKYMDNFVSTDSSGEKYVNGHSRPPLPPKKRHCLQHMSNLSTAIR